MGFSLSCESENHEYQEVESEMSCVDLKVKVIPLAKENRVVGYQGDVLKVKVTAPPVKENVANAPTVPNNGISVSLRRGGANAYSSS